MFSTSPSRNFASDLDWFLLPVRFWQAIEFLYHKWTSLKPIYRAKSLVITFGLGSMLMISCVIALIEVSQAPAFGSVPWVATGSAFMAYMCLVYPYVMFKVGQFAIRKYHLGKESQKLENVIEFFGGDQSVIIVLKNYLHLWKQVGN